MKAIVLIDIPDEQLEGIDSPLENMYANVTLDYDEKVIYTIGEVKEMEQPESKVWREEEIKKV